MAMKAEATRCARHFRAEYADTMCRIGEVLLSFSSATLTLITFGTAYWVQASPSGKESGKGTELLFHAGLWQNCSLTDTVNCQRLSISGPAYLIASRLFMTLALISCVLSALLSVVGLLRHNYKWLFAATGAYSVQAFLSLLGLASFSPGLKQLKDDTNVHRRSGWSYSVGWISMVISIVCAIYFVSVGVYRLKNRASGMDRAESRSYAPLAQLESTDSDDDYDDDL